PPVLRDPIGDSRLAGEAGLDVLPGEPHPDALDRFCEQRPLYRGVADRGVPQRLRKLRRADADPDGQGTYAQRNHSVRANPTAAAANAICDNRRALAQRTAVPHTERVTIDRIVVVVIDVDGTVGLGGGGAESVPERAEPDLLASLSAPVLCQGRMSVCR